MTKRLLLLLVSLGFFGLTFADQEVDEAVDEEFVKRSADEGTHVPRPDDEFQIDLIQVPEARTRGS